MTFREMNLAASINKAIEVCGYNTPTPVQLQAIPKIMNGEDIVACAPTGTGKTAAFVLPSLHRLSAASDARKPRILVLTPTRELAAQITQAAVKYGKFLKFNMASLVGGMPYRQQLRALSRPVDMIVATPGRLLDHMENRRIDLSGIEILILDEADRMLDMGFIDDVQAVANVTPKSRQTLLFSATVDGRVSQVVKSLLKNPARVDISQDKLSPAQIKQELYLADNAQHKMRLLQHFLNNGNMFKAIIFTATKIGADKLAGQLDDQGYSSAALHGDLKQSQRNRTIEQMRRGKIQFLVATDVAARGIDISDMTHVVNYDLPRFNEDYVHRIGRTGRAGKSGIAISFALPSDAIHVQRIEKYISSKLEILEVEGIPPTQKHLNPNPPRKSKGRKSSSGGRNGKSNFSSGRADSNRGQSRRGDRSSAHSSETHRSKRGYDDSRPARKDSDRGRPSFDSAERGGVRRENKSDFKSERGSRGRPSFDSAERGGVRRENKSDFKSERGSRGRPSFDSAERGGVRRENKSDFKSERGSRGRPSFDSAERGGVRRENKSDFKSERGSRGRPSFDSAERGGVRRENKSDFKGERGSRDRTSFESSERGRGAAGRKSDFTKSPRSDRDRPQFDSSERSSVRRGSKPAPKTDYSDRSKSRFARSPDAAATPHRDRKKSDIKPVRAKKEFSNEGSKPFKKVKVAYKSKKD